MDSPPILVTPRAAAKAAELARRDGQPPVLRLGVQGGGCSGLSYVYTFDAEAPRPGDLCWQVDGLAVRCDPKSLTFLSGTQLDYDTNLLRGGFRFTNPQARRSCSCGASFAT